MAEYRQLEIKAWQEKAVRYFCSKPANFPTGRAFNCCESILLTLSEYLKIDTELIPKLGTAIGAGVGLNGLLCGSVSGVALAIGMKRGRNRPDENPSQAWTMIDQYIAMFKQKFGYVNCSQLTGVNLKMPDGLKEYHTRIHDIGCADRVRFAVRQAVELLTEIS
jgi:C_GCAxxG_C_C family probable redox protein